jgi:hypothetical protein
MKSILVGGEGSEKNILTPPVKQNSGFPDIREPRKKLSTRDP